MTLNAHAVTTPGGASSRLLRAQTKDKPIEDWYKALKLRMQALSSDSQPTSPTNGARGNAKTSPNAKTDAEQPNVPRTRASSSPNAPPGHMAANGTISPARRNLEFQHRLSTAGAQFNSACARVWHHVAFDACFGVKLFNHAACVYVCIYIYINIQKQTLIHIHLNTVKILVRGMSGTGKSTLVQILEVSLASLRYFFEYRILVSLWLIIDTFTAVIF